MYAENGIRFLTEDAATALIRHGCEHLSSKWAKTNEHAKMLLELCEVALLHDMVEEARWLCRMSWDYVLGYGNRKDTTILTLLDAIGYLSYVAPAECRAALNKVAPQIHHITDYTDGDETRHAHSYTNRLLAKLDPLSLAENYAGHISAGGWNYADEAFAARFDADLASPMLEAIARTGLPSEAMSNLHTRAKQGDMGAAKD